jgi:hypothetical protein
MSVQTDKTGNVITGGVNGTYVEIGAVRYYGFNTAITANTTLVTNTADGVAAPAGSRGRTTHATGQAKAFVSDGTKWQFEAVA